MIVMQTVYEDGHSETSRHDSVTSIIRKMEMDFAGDGFLSVTLTAVDR
jgi:hypothetical protein